MKCDAVYGWLLISRARDALPREVARHLKDCRTCRARRRRLRRLDLMLEQVPVPALEPSTRERLLGQLEARPTSKPCRRRPWRPLLSAAATLLVGVGLGWFLTAGPRNRSAPTLSASAQRLTPAALATDALVGRFVRHHIDLAATYQPAKQLALLDRMAADLRTEALRRVREGTPEDVPLVVGLHERVLRQGLVGLLRSVPAAERAALVPPLVRELRHTEAEVESATGEVAPAVSLFLQPMAAAAHEVGETLRDSDGLGNAQAEPPPPPLGMGFATPSALLAVLVTNGLLLAGEDDPLVRASYCNVTADQLALGMLLASANGDAELAAQLGNHLGEMVDGGVNANLKRAQEEDASDPRLEDLIHVSKRAVRAIESLKRNLGKGIKPAQAELRRAIATSNYPLVRDLDKAMKDVGHALQGIMGDRKPPGHKGREIRGMVRAVDAAGKTVVLSVREQDREFEATYRLADGARIRQGPIDLDLTDLVPGTRVKVTLTEAGTLKEIKREPKQD